MVNLKPDWPSEPPKPGLASKAWSRLVRWYVRLLERVWWSAYCSFLDRWGERALEQTDLGHGNRRERRGWWFYGEWFELDYEEDVE